MHVHYWPWLSFDANISDQCLLVKHTGDLRASGYSIHGAPNFNIKRIIIQSMYITLSTSSFSLEAVALFSQMLRANDIEKRSNITDCSLSWPFYCSFHFCFSWKVKLLVTPSKLVLLTGVSLLGICVFIGLIILLLHLKEKVR